MPAPTRFPLVALALAMTASAVAQAADPEGLAALGVQRAANSRFTWEMGDATHPTLGALRYARMLHFFPTPVGTSRILSRVQFACVRATGKIAVTLSHRTKAEDPALLETAAPPELACNRPDGAPEIAAAWESEPVTAASIARDIAPSALRACVAIGISQEVVLPPGWAAKKARVVFAVYPYGRELDEIFLACGEKSAYGVLAIPAPVIPNPAGGEGPASMTQAARPTAPPVALDGWREARAISAGKSNIRSKPTLKSAIVAQVHPGQPLRVRRAEGDWWEVRPAKGSAFEGFIRDDRLSYPR